MTGIYLISQERERQIAEEGFTAEHDAAHTNNELSWAAVHWAMPDSVKMDQGGIDVHIYPELFALKASYGRKPIRFNRWQGDRIKQLVYAGALVAAEIDRLLVDQPKPNIAEIFSELREKFGHCFDDIGDPLEFQRRMRDGDEVVDLQKQLAEAQERIKKLEALAEAVKVFCHVYDGMLHDPTADYEAMKQLLQEADNAG